MYSESSCFPAPVRSAALPNEAPCAYAWAAALMPRLFNHAGDKPAQQVTQLRHRRHQRTQFPTRLARLSRPCSCSQPRQCRKRFFFKILPAAACTHIRLFQKLCKRISDYRNFHQTLGIGCKRVASSIRTQLLQARHVMRSKTFTRLGSTPCKQLVNLRNRSNPFFLSIVGN